MAVNYFFNNFTNSQEQDLIENLVVESIKIYGIDSFYIPRNVQSTRDGMDEIFNEVTTASFTDNYMLDVYIRNIDSFDGDGAFMSKFGLEIRDQITFSVAIKTFNLEVSQQTWHNHAYDDAETVYSETLEKPREGDLIYLPLNKKIFEIRKVNHEAVFYQLGQLQFYDLVCELFEYSGEHFDTGIPEIDHFYQKLDQRFTTDMKELSENDHMSDNYQLQVEAEKIVDWSERDPFSEGGKW